MADWKKGDRRGNNQDQNALPVAPGGLVSKSHLSLDQPKFDFSAGEGWLLRLRTGNAARNAAVAGVKECLDAQLTVLKDWLKGIVVIKKREVDDAVDRAMAEFDAARTKLLGGLVRKNTQALVELSIQLKVDHSRFVAEVRRSDDLDDERKKEAIEDLGRIFQNSNEQLMARLS